MVPIDIPLERTMTYGTNRYPIRKNHDIWYQYISN